MADPDVEAFALNDAARRWFERRCEVVVVPTPLTAGALHRRTFETACLGSGSGLTRPAVLGISLIFLCREASVNRSRRAIFLLCSISLAQLASVAAVANNSGWRIYSEEANGDVYFFDESRVSRNSDVHEVWTRIRYKASVMGASSYQSLMEIDCTARTERTVQRTFFSDRQWEDPAMSTDTKAKPKRSIREGSASERLSQILCTQ